MKSSKSIDEMAKTLLDRHKCMDVLVNSAGIFPMEGQTPLEGMYIYVHMRVVVHSSAFIQCMQLNAIVTCVLSLYWFPKVMPVNAWDLYWFPKIALSVNMRGCFHQN